MPIDLYRPRAHACYGLLVFLSSCTKNKSEVTTWMGLFGHHKCSHLMCNFPEAVQLARTMTADRNLDMSCSMCVQIQRHVMPKSSDSQFHIMAQNGSERL
eukprot:TRINITY_DN91479_c0_g1_i1.p1 TRINITY_DN91479_c0_g1~~TRINITY_DN91479_c0_g1_i1.p1  ORF type:complete len:110 (-),score=4.73 TRINITY_DN91479_c0_g1_i1:72-371(-)